MLSDQTDAVPPCRDTDETNAYAGAVALAAFNGAIIGAAGCAVECYLRDLGTACLAGLGALVCLAVWERQLLGADASERR